MIKLYNYKKIDNEYKRCQLQKIKLFEELDTKNIGKAIFKLFWEAEIYTIWFPCQHFYFRNNIGSGVFGGI